MKADGPSDARSRSHFHRSLPCSFRAQAEDMKLQSEECLSAMNALCRASALLSETFVGVFQDTPFAELALRVKQVSQDLASRTLNASEHIQEDGIAMVTRMLARGTKEKTDEGVQVLARCFLLMLQTQCHFFRSAAEVFSPLGRYKEVEDLLIGEHCEERVREACNTWIQASQATKSLRTELPITASERQLLENVQHRKGHQVDHKVTEVKQKIDMQISVYKQALTDLPDTEFAMYGGFHLHPQCTSLIAQGCCGNAECNELISQSNTPLHFAMPASGQSQRLSLEELKKDLHDVLLQVEGSPCQRSQNEEENFKIKLQAVQAIVSETAKQQGALMNKGQVSLAVLCEACPSVAETQSKLAVQLLFGKADVVRIKPANPKGNLQKYAQISSQDGVFIIEVPTTWSLEQCHHSKSPAGEETSLGVVEVIYTRQIELSTFLEGKQPPLPIIQIKLRHSEQPTTSTPAHRGTVKPSTGEASSGSPPGKGFRHTVEKLASKFRMGSGQLPKAPSSEFYVDVPPEPVSEQTNHKADNFTGNQSVLKQEQATQQQGPVSCSTLKRDIAKDTVFTATQRPTMVGPTVTITSHPSPTVERHLWNKNAVSFKAPATESRKCFASDTDVQDVVDLLSGIPRAPQPVIGQHLDTFNQSQRSPQNTTPTSSTSSGSAHGSVWPNAGGAVDPNPAKYGNFNPTFQAETRDRVGEISTSNMAAVSRAWSNPHAAQTRHHPLINHYSQPFSSNHQNVHVEREIASMYDNSNSDAEFAKYVATNYLGKRTKGYTKDLNTVSDQWSYPGSRLNQTWPTTHEGTLEAQGGTDHLNQSLTGQHDSGSSSDESGENGDSAFSMGLGLTGPNFVASVNRRRHSSGGEEVVHGQRFDPIGQLGMKYLEVAQMEPKSTKTWPPKVLWQRAICPNDDASPTPGLYSLPPNEQLLVHPPLTPQWSDPVTLRQHPVWPLAGGSTPVSPAGSISRLAPSQPILQRPSMGGGVMGGIGGGASVARPHPKLDRKYAYSQY